MTNHPKIATPSKSIINPTTGQAMKANFAGGGASAALKALEEIDPATFVCKGFRILVRIKRVEEISPNGVFLPDTAIEKELFGKCQATLVHHGKRCFQEMIAAEETPPAIGDTVVIAKYAGLMMRDKEFNLYRLANDEDIAAVIERKK